MLLEKINDVFKTKKRYIRWMVNSGLIVVRDENLLNITVMQLDVIYHN